MIIVHLEERQNDDGGWGAHARARSNAECTALALLACESWPGPETRAERLEAAEAWLLNRQQPGGAWNYDDQGPEAPWPTPLALLALQARGTAEAARDDGYAWLVRQRGAALSWRVRLRDFLVRRQVVELDSTLSGWPWTPDTFSWIEPTAWALLALKVGWPGRAPRHVAARVREGESMILDRVCPGGGWNYGNSRVLGADLDPYPDTTALALLGLVGRPAPAVGEGFAVLDRLLGEHASALALSLAVLSRRAWLRPADDLLARLADLPENAGTGDTRTLALHALAVAPRLGWLRGGTNA